MKLDRNLKRGRLRKASTSVDDQLTTWTWDLGLFDRLTTSLYIGVGSHSINIA